MASTDSTRMTIRNLGYTPGTLKSGPSNSILDVPGVHISQVTVPTTSTLPEGSTATKGVTVISPRPPHEFYKPCNAGSFVFNGNGALTGSQQIADWGFTNTPIVFTNSFSLGTVVDGVWDFVIRQQDKLGWDELTRSRHYGTPVVGETADWTVNADVRHSRVSREDIKRAFDGLKSKEDGAFVEEGQYGGGSGMTCHHFTGGTGTSSRLVGGGNGSKEYTLGVIVQSNYGRLGDLQIGGVPVGRLLLKEKVQQAGVPVTQLEGGAGVGGRKKQPELEGRSKDGSILILVSIPPMTSCEHGGAIEAVRIYLSACSERSSIYWCAMPNLWTKGEVPRGRDSRPLRCHLPVGCAWNPC